MPGVVVHACNPSTWEAEAGKLPIGSQPELYSETLSPKQNKTKQNKTKGGGMCQDRIQTPELLPNSLLEVELECYDVMLVQV
jgi:hypothetical protein